MARRQLLMQQTFERLQRRRYLRGDFTTSESQTESHLQRSAGNRNLGPPSSSPMRWFERMQREAPMTRARSRQYLNQMNRSYWARRAARIPSEQHTRAQEYRERQSNNATSQNRRGELNVPVVQVNSVPVNDFSEQSSSGGVNSLRRSYPSNIMHPFPIPAHYSHSSTGNSERNSGGPSTLYDEPIPSTSQNNNPSRAQV